MTEDKIRYWDHAEWTWYIKDHIIPLYILASTLYNIWLRLREFDGRLIVSIQEEEPNLGAVFLGGTEPPGRYSEGSFAKICNRLFGTTVDLKDYYSALKLGVEPKVPCSVGKSIFILYIEWIWSLLVRILGIVRETELISEADLKTADEKSKNEVTQCMENLERIIDLLLEFINTSINLTVSNNLYTRFIWFTRKITKRYAEQLYPGITDAVNYAELQRILGWNLYFIPQIQELREEHTLYSYDYSVKARFNSVPDIFFDGADYVAHKYIRGHLCKMVVYLTIGGCVCKINDLIWGMFTELRDDLSLIVEPIPNPLNEWIDFANTWLTNVEWSAPPPDSFNKTSRTHFGWYEIRLSSYQGIAALNDLMPAVIVGKYELVVEDSDDENTIYIVERW